METLISKLRERIAAAQFQSEAAVREAIVLPILQALGWDTLDPTSVVREYPLAGRRVDYALSSLPGRKEIFIEVKALGQSATADRQLFEYAFHEGIPFAILTDGREWSFFLPGEQGTYDERRVQKLDIVERAPQDVISIFNRYLDRERVRSGEAIQSARADYQNISKRKNAANEIPKAWSDLVSEPDELLIDLIAEKTETLCGFRPAAEDVENFLVAMLSPPAIGKPTPPPARRPESGPSVIPGPPPVSERGVQYRILGQTKNASTAIDALIDILRTLARRNPAFLEAVSKVVRARTRNHIARSRGEVYPRKPELVEYTVELEPGWWLGTNIANRDKMRIIRKACEVERLAFGRDVAIALPNAE